MGLLIVVILSTLCVGRVESSALTSLYKTLPRSSGGSRSAVKEVDDNFVYVQRKTADEESSWVDIIKKTELTNVYHVLRHPSPKGYDRFGAYISSNNEHLVVHGILVNFTGSSFHNNFIYKIVLTKQLFLVRPQRMALVGLVRDT